jgi:hypothetical protein
MGNRANFGFKHADGNTVFLYSHWGGGSVFLDLANALRESAARINDEGYGTRMVISHIIGNDWHSQYNYGIYINQMGDNENPVPVVDFASQSVSVYLAADVTSGFLPDDAYATVSIGQFIDEYLINDDVAQEEVSA